MITVCSGQPVPWLTLDSYALLNSLFLRGCLHDTGATFIPVRVHSGSLLWFCIRLHDTSTKSRTGASHTGASHPGYCTGARFSLRYENSFRCHVKAVRLFVPARNHSPGSLKRVAHACVYEITRRPTSSVYLCNREMKSHPFM